MEIPLLLLEATLILLKEPLEIIKRSGKTLFVPDDSAGKSLAWQGG
jgi:hypothetical protein